MRSRQAAKSFISRGGAEDAEKYRGGAQFSFFDRLRGTGCKSGEHDSSASSAPLREQNPLRGIAASREINHLIHRPIEWRSSGIE